MAGYVKVKKYDRWLPLTRVNTLGGLLIVTMVLAALSLCKGSAPLSLEEVWQALLRQGETQNQVIVWELRLPRFLVAATVGASLGMAGAMLQGLLRNTLADPYVLGISAGAGVVAIALISMGAAASVLPLASWLGAILTTVMIFGLSYDRGRGVTIERLVLVGIAVGALLGAIQTILLLLADEGRVQSALNWLIGSLNGRGWKELTIVAPYVIVGVLLGTTGAKTLNALSLGDELAGGLGVTLWRARLYVGGVASLLAACAVSVAGLIGFIGLVVPHGVRLIVGTDYRWLLPLSAWGGAIVLSAADLLARSTTIELPVGAVTAMLGAPLFVWIIYTRSRQW
jgi:iron complex transport system permease protein